LISRENEADIKTIPRNTPLNMIVTKEQFEAIAVLVGDKSIKPQRAATYAERCRIYGLYKRATVGRLLPPFQDDDVEASTRPTSRPGILSIEARAKYDAWEACQEMSREEAMVHYAKLAEEILGQPVIDILNC
jgi:acyl-CoA-binding protein